MEKYTFKKALPVWEKDKEKEVHYNLVFRCVLPKLDNACIALSSSNIYQLFVNGNMISEGPARAGHGYYRVDEIDLSKYLTADKNVISIIVCAYNIKNFCYLKQDGFLCAEVLCDSKVICATGHNGFDARYMSEKLRKVCRYSYQRTFTESYVLDETQSKFATDPDFDFERVTLAVQPDKRFIARYIPYPCYDFVGAEKVVAKGSVTYLDAPGNPKRDRVIINDLEEYICYSIDEMDFCVCDELYKIKNDTPNLISLSAENVEIPADSYAIFSLPGEKAGFMTLEVCASEDTTLFLNFEEILTDCDINNRRCSTNDVITFSLKKGDYKLISVEPYTFKFIKAINQSKGSITIKKIGVTEFENAYHSKGLNSGNQKLDIIYEAAIESFRQNALDLFMDCPGRERAGWLCDSFFTSRVENLLTGKSLIEKNFLENFIFDDGVENIPEDMLGMCYPSDFPKTEYIPQWSLWYILELGEYFERTGDRQLIIDAKDKMMRLLRYFSNYENSDGLLENLEGWRFVEWSHANDLVDGVNYPTNMLYSKALKILGTLYGMDELIEKSLKIADTVRKQSFDGVFFRDQALRNDNGELELVKDTTEVCQYYAFFTDVATFETYPALWNTLVTQFGSDRLEKGLWKEIYPTNVLPGYILRLDLLSKAGEKEQLLANLEGYFYNMACLTGTLWEYDNTRASCNHGFTSHLLVWLEKYARRK